MQAPTIGRRVWYWQAAGDGGVVRDTAQAFDAGVIFVHPIQAGEYCVDLQVTDHAGNTDVIQNVILQDYEDGDAHHLSDIDGFATWMPYQQKKHEQESAAS